jgi:hypothetical protein
MRGFVAGIIEAIAHIRRRPNEAKAALQKYTRVSQSGSFATRLRPRYSLYGICALSEGIKTILDQFGVSGRPAETFLAEFIDDRFMKQLSDEGFVRQLYPGGVPGPKE